MTDIVINLDETCFAPAVDMTLLDMLKAGDFSWPVGSTCLTQESDGALMWWSAPIQEVIAAREKASLDDGLMPIVGWDFQVHMDYYLHCGREVVANDWTSAVVTMEQFIGMSFYRMGNQLMDDFLIEKLSVAKDYIQNIVGYTRINGVMQPSFDVVNELTKNQAMNVIRTYYKGDSIKDLPLDW